MFQQSQNTFLVGFLVKIGLEDKEIHRFLDHNLQYVRCTRISVCQGRMKSLLFPFFSEFNGSQVKVNLIHMSWYVCLGSLNLLAVRKVFSSLSHFCLSIELSQKIELHCHIKRKSDCEILAFQVFDLSSMLSRGGCIHLTHYFFKGYILPIKRVLL